jgi:hypothetical protein
MYSGITKIQDRKSVGPVFTILFLCGYVKDRVFVLPLSCDLSDLKARIIAAVKNIDAPMLTCVFVKNLNIVSMCALSPMVHTSNISSCQKNFFSFPVAVNNSFKVGPSVFLL